MWKGRNEEDGDRLWRRKFGFGGQMKLKLIEEKNREIEIEVIGGKTMLNPLKEKLLENDDVEYAEWTIESPISSNSTFYLRVKKGNARETMKKAVKELKKEVDSFKKLVEDKIDEMNK
jgi:DNA-directed RNA polymerase subunit L